MLKKLVNEAFCTLRFHRFVFAEDKQVIEPLNFGALGVKRRGALL